VRRNYQIVGSEGKVGERHLAEFFRKNGQQLLPMVELIEQCRLAVDDVIEVLGRKTIETILEVSAAQIAGPRAQGKAGGEVQWHGHQQGRVRLNDRKLVVKKPRLRRKGKGAGQEVAIPAYDALQRDEATGARMLETLLCGVSTRQYQRVIPEMAETVGVSRSSVSREAAQAAEAELEKLMNRDWSQVELLVIYIDGMRFGSHHALSAVGVDAQGNKHVLGMQDGASENTEAVKTLLVHLRDHGVASERRYLFVIDGAKALRAAINEVFGAHQPVQRCRTHKLRNVLQHLPKDQHDQVKAVIRAAYRLDAKTGMAKLRTLADWLRREWEQAAQSLLEGLEETFTVNTLEVPPSLHRCLATTNIIESPQSGVRKRTGNVTRWRDAAMVKRWAASAFLVTEKNFRKIMGHRELWALAAILGRTTKTSQEKVA
jgi:putative transposase